MSRDDATVLDITRAAALVLDFVRGCDRSTFETDWKTQSAVIHQLLVIGEAVKRLSEDFRNRYPDVPWKAVAGMRDQLIHAYDTVDLSEVWKTVTVDLPVLTERLESIRSDRPREDDRTS